MNRVFVDLDGVTVDFDGHMAKHQISADELKKVPGAYLEMESFPGALEGIRTLLAEGYDVFFATKPPTGIPHAYSDKAAWVFKHIPEMKRRLIITPDKGLLGDKDDILIDDRPQKANCLNFKGPIIIVVGTPDWKFIVDHVHLGPEKLLEMSVLIEKVSQ